MNLPIFNHHDYQIESPRTNSQQVSDHQSHGPSHNADLVGRPISFIGGQFAGQTVRAELHEIQKANLGRKYARVDRRPLDPPPVVLLKLFYVYNVGTNQETEKEVRNYDEIQNLGLVCTVDLFPAPSQEPTRKDTKEGTSRRMVTAPSNQTPYSSAILSQYPPQPHPQAYTFAPSNPYSSAAGPKTAGPSHSTHASGSHYTQPYVDPSDIVHHVGDYPVTERSKCTYALVGSTFVQPANVDYQGKKSLMFVFADLAVKTEGTFILRYRTFDIFSQALGSGLVVQAECYGGVFQVYSTKEFPGLQASTELTKQLARWGVRLNIRETERKRRKKGDRRGSSPQFQEPGEGKDPPDGKDTYDESDDD